jgi:hypothetical protein
MLPPLLLLLLSSGLVSPTITDPRTEWCPRYHGVNAQPGDIYDPSGPVKLGETWYVFADGAGVHWESEDLLRWRAVSPGWFSGLTGSITRTPAGVFALYVDNEGMVRRAARGMNLSDWGPEERVAHDGVAGGMDLAEAFLLGESWRMPVLAGDGRLGLMRATNDTLSAFDSNALVVNETTLPGYMDGGTATWHAQPNMPMHGAHFECGDIFMVDDRTVVLASVSRGGPSNSLWWVGDINETDVPPPPPGGGCAPLPCQGHPGITFCPTNKTSGQCATPMPHLPCPPGDCPPPPSPATFVAAQTAHEGPCGRVAGGSLDYGNWYSAKHGSDSLLTNSSRNLVFGVAGLSLGSKGSLAAPAWMEQCKRYHTIPRDIKPDPSTRLLRITPIPEITTLRNGSIQTHVTGSVQVGSQAEVRLSCSGMQLDSGGGGDNDDDAVPAAHGREGGATAGALFGIDVLATADSSEYTRLGINLTRADADSPPTAFVDTSHTAAGGGANQSAYSNPGTNVVPLWQLHSSASARAADATLRGGGSSSIEITVLVDGGMIEAFFGEQCPITTLVQPSEAAPPHARYIRPFNTAVAGSGVNCDVSVSRLMSLV